MGWSQIRAEGRGAHRAAFVLGRAVPASAVAAGTLRLSWQPRRGLQGLSEPGKVAAAADGGPVSLGRGCWPEQRAVNKAKPTRDACMVGALQLCARREAIRSCLQPAGAAAGFLGRLDEQQQARCPFQKLQCFMLRCDLARGGSEGGEAATSHKGLVFSVVKALPPNQRDSRYFYSVIFPYIPVLPASQSKPLRTSVSPPPWQPLHLLFFVGFVLFLALGFFPRKTSNWLWRPSSEPNPPSLV